MVSRASRAVARTSETPTSVYRYYDRLGTLIYVGITRRGMARNAEHNTRAQWWPFVVRQEVDHFPSRAEAASREKELIRRYRPPFNTAHNLDSAEARSAYLYWSDGTPVMQANRLVAEVGKTLPFLPEPLDGDHFILATPPGFMPIARLVQSVDGSEVYVQRIVGRVISMENTGSRVLLLVERKKRNPLPPLDQYVGMARLKYLCQKPVSLRIGMISLVPRVSGAGVSGDGLGL